MAEPYRLWYRDPWMVVEPMAGDRLEDNLNPVGRL
jgi:hypothetical protein